MEIIITSKGHPLYVKGRDLADYVYNKVWSTSSLIDHNHIGVIALKDNQVVGNINICLDASNLPCERFFILKNLSLCGKIKVELCGLAISTDLTRKSRSEVLLGLVSAVHMFGLKNDIKTYFTIQKSTLFSHLTSKLSYPFQLVLGAEICTEVIPEDKYWQCKNKPNLYQVENFTEETQAASLVALMKLMQNGFTLKDITHEEVISDLLSKVA